jgi:hypothetical protein
VPTSVLLAVLAAAGLLALAPALVRRYDATERLVAERALSTARVLDRHRRRRTVPGRRPVNPPRAVTATVTVAQAAPISVAPVSAAPVSAFPVSAIPLTFRGGRRTGGRPPRSQAVYRRRRVLAALVLLNLIELVGVGLVGLGFAIGCAGSGALLLIYLVHLRQRAVVDRRRRRAAARRAAWLAARQAEIRREQSRRQAARREAARRAAAARVAAQREAVQLSQRYVDGSGGARVRGRPYESRAVGY